MSGVLGKCRETIGPGAENIVHTRNPRHNLIRIFDASCTARMLVQRSHSVLFSPPESPAGIRGGESFLIVKGDDAPGIRLHPTGIEYAKIRLSSGMTQDVTDCQIAISLRMYAVFCATNRKKS